MIFTDKEFPPELSSLVNEGAKRPEKIPWEQIEWTRISNIPALKNKRGQLTIFGDEVSPHDIKQSKQSKPSASQQAEEKMHGAFTDKLIKQLTHEQSIRKQNSQLYQSLSNTRKK